MAKTSKNTHAEKCTYSLGLGEVLACMVRENLLGHDYVRDNGSACWIRSCDMRYIQAHSLDNEQIRSTGFVA